VPVFARASSKKRVVFILHEMEACPGEIAEALQIREGTVHSASITPAATLGPVERSK